MGSFLYAQQWSCWYSWANPEQRLVEALGLGPKENIPRFLRTHARTPARYFFLKQLLFSKLLLFFFMAIRLIRHICSGFRCSLGAGPLPPPPPQFANCGSNLQEQMVFSVMCKKPETETAQAGVLAGDPEKAKLTVSWAPAT